MATSKCKVDHLNARYVYKTMWSWETSSTAILVAYLLLTTMSDLRRRQILVYSAIALSLIAVGATICAHEEDLLRQQRRKERRRRRRNELLKEGQTRDAPEQAGKKRLRDVNSDVGEAETRQTKLPKTDVESSSKHNFLGTHDLYRLSRRILP